MANEKTKELPMWKRIKQGDKLPCQSFLRKYDGEILRLTTTGGVTVGQDCFYLPVENVIEEIRKYPIEESKDEKMIQYFKDLAPFDKAEELYEKYGFSHKDAIEWLEKKGEQDYTTKSGSRFNVGDWICHKVYKKPLRIVEDLGDGDFRTSPNSIVSAKEIEEGVFKHWYITDAKPGDILYSLDSYVPFIYKGRKAYEQASTYCGININGKFYIEGTKDCIICCEHYRPASSEQRSLLFSKMREAGYEWNAEKLELKKIEQKPILDVEIPFGAKDSELEDVTYDIPKGYHAEIEDNKVIIKKGEKKSSWSEEDENLLKLSIENLTELKDRFGEEYGKVGDCIVWFESIKDRVQPRPHWKPSEEQLDALNNMRFAVQHFGPSASLAALDDLYNQLEKLTE